MNPCTSPFQPARNQAISPGSDITGRVDRWETAAAWPRKEGSLQEHEEDGKR